MGCQGLAGATPDFLLQEGGGLGLRGSGAPVGVFERDAAFLLTVGSFRLTVELFYLQLTILAFLLAVGAFFRLQL